MTGSSTLLSALQDPMPGQVIAQKYRLERCLGEGGQGSVWRAENLVLELPVALKLVHPEAVHGLVPDRLFREARAAATLGHPAIVRIFDVGRTADGLPFLVMELLRGESLADELTRTERLSPARALRLLLPIADGLAAAHAERIVHRDVKPDNIFIAVSGDWIQPKLLDFGLARRSISGDRLGRLTDAGAVLGTPAYLSPEQASGRGEVDARADVWSFSATLYECLTGVVPFQALSWHQLRRQILRDEPAPLEEYGVAEVELWQILRRGLAKSPDERWPTMQALGRTLAAWLVERGVTSDVCGVSLEARWLRAEAVTAAPPRVVTEPEPPPPRKQTLRLAKSATRRRDVPAAEPAETRPPPTPSRRHRWVWGTAAAFGCVAVGLFTTAAQRPHESGGGIISSSRAAVPPPVAQPAPKASAVPIPIVLPVPSPAVAPVPMSTPTVERSSPRPAAAQRSPAAAPAAAAPPRSPESTTLPAPRPAELKALSAPAESLDLMEPY